MTAVPTERRELSESVPHREPSALGRCIAAESADFAEHYWDQRPLHSRAADLPRDFTDLLSPDAVDELIAQRGVRTPFIRMAKDGALLSRSCFTAPGGLGAEMPDQVDSAGVLTQFAAGATVVLQGLHRLWPPIMEFSRGLVDDLGHPVQANAYITPPSNRGFDPHYDTHDVFVLQVSGTKEWIVHAPVHDRPLPHQPWTTHRGAVASAAQSEPFLHATLRPGDALYLPRGWIHSARAQGETSIHLTIGVAPTTRYDVVQLLATVLGDDAALRRALPLGINQTDAAALADKISEAVALTVKALSDSSLLSDTVANAVGERFISLTRPEPVRPLATLTAMTNLDEQTPVQRRHGLVVTEFASDSAAVIKLADREIAFPPQCAPALKAIIACDMVTARELPGLSVEDALVVLRRLLREGVVVAVSTAPIRE
ncbi:MAG: cupin [Rhodococcus sp.]|nr:cupin [Rhodococcus sp. (in: high G+C Gram-positive bacteria)]